jgi:DNA-binding CsgD family transcriptional regulator
MSVRSALGPADRTGVEPTGWDGSAGSRMSHVDAAAVVAISAGVVTLLAFADPRDALGYLLAFPIWIVAKDLGVRAGAVAGACALIFVVVFGATQDVVLGPLGYLGCAAVFFGTVAAGAWSGQANGSGPAQRSSLLLPILTVRPEITKRDEALSRRELQILEMIATGAKNAQIAERFVISQNTVKSHVSRILQKLPATNRTEAAFRYIELYGAPSSPEGQSAAADRANGRITATSAMKATVSALPRDDALLLRLQDGRDLEVPLLEQLRERVDVGASAIVYFNQHERTIGWYLPDEEIGVDLRHWTP